MSASTLGELIGAHGVEVLEHLDRGMEVPVLGGLQLQGDLAVIPGGHGGKGAAEVIPQAGVAVIEALAGGHEHRLLGPVAWLPAGPGGQDLGYLSVPDGGQGFLAHPEHGYLGIAPGSYVLRRQREQADEERLIAD
jgi:hypothetical protein